MKFKFTKFTKLGISLLGLVSINALTLNYASAEDEAMGSCNNTGGSPGDGG